MFDSRFRYVALALALAPVVAIAVTVARAPKERPGLVVYMKEDRELALPPKYALLRAGRLARASLSKRERAELTATLDKIAGSLERPDSSNESSIEAETSLRGLAGGLSARTKGARLLSGEPIRIPETAFVAELATKCEPSPGLRCFLVNAPKDAVERTALSQFDVILHALRIQILPPSDFVSAYERLNDGASRPTSRIALAVGPKTLTRDDAFRESVVRTIGVLERAKKEVPSPLVDLAADGRDDLPAWLELAGHEVLVVPRSATSPELVELEREVRDLLAKESFTLEPIAKP